LDWVNFVGEALQPEGTASLRAGGAAESRRELLRATVQRSAQIDERALLLEQPDYLMEYQRARLLQSFATRYAEPQVDFAAIDEAIKVRDEQLLSGVQPVVSESTQLVGTSSRVPIKLTNALPFDAQVTVVAVP